MCKRQPLALFVVVALLFLASPLTAQQRTITGRVTSEQGTPLSAVSVVVKGTGAKVSTNNEGRYSVAAETGQVLQFRLIGSGLVERTVGSEDVIDVQLKRVAMDLDAVIVTAMGETASRRPFGASQQSLDGDPIAQTQRPNFANALAGRIAGLDVTSTSGVPGASSSIVIRGVGSISSSNQPLIIVDGLPMDNRPLNTGVLASDRSSTTAFSNRTVDFSNRASDLNPEDIETLTVLKGPEAAALYGIDAANGAIVITTKRGKAGGGWEYSNSFRIEATGARPKLQRVYGPSTVIGETIGSFQYFGSPYPAGTRFYDNIDGFLRTGTTQTHNLSFSGATTDGRMNYRLATSGDKQNGVVPNSDYGRINVTGSSQAQVTPWLNTDLSMAYTYDTNNQPFKGTCGAISTCSSVGALIGLML